MIATKVVKDFVVDPRQYIPLSLIWKLGEDKCMQFASPGGYTPLISFDRNHTYCTKPLTLVTKYIACESLLFHYLTTYAYFIDFQF